MNQDMNQNYMFIPIGKNNNIGYKKGMINSNSLQMYPKICKKQ